MQKDKHKVELKNVKQAKKRAIQKQRQRKIQNDGKRKNK